MARPMRVVEGVAEDRCAAEQHKSSNRLQRARSVHCRQCADRKEQRITGQEGRDHEAGLGKDDHEQDQVHPAVVARHQLDEVPVEVHHEVIERQPEVDQRLQPFHRNVPALLAEALDSDHGLSRVHLVAGCREAHLHRERVELSFDPLALLAAIYIAL